jgi:hypothetical protein
MPEWIASDSIAELPPAAANSFAAIMAKFAATAPTTAAFDSCAMLSLDAEAGLSETCARVSNAKK